MAGVRGLLKKTKHRPLPSGADADMFEPQATPQSIVARLSLMSRRWIGGVHMHPARGWRARVDGLGAWEGLPWSLALSPVTNSRSPEFLMTLSSSCASARPVDSQGHGKGLQGCHC